MTTETEEPELPTTIDKIKVSGSEALSIGTCERKHMYAFHPGYALEAKYQGDAITRGLIGHAALEIYYGDIMRGKTLEDAKNSVKAFLSAQMVEAMVNENTRVVDIVTGLMGLLLKDYFESEHNRKFLESTRILGVEYGVSVDLPGRTTLPGKLDVLVKYIKGDWNGEVAPVDHKFVYNFWGENAFRMNAQMPNYIYCLRHMMPGAVIRRGVINQIRWRDNASQQFRFDEIKASKPEVEELILNHIGLAEWAAHNRSLPVEKIRRDARRSISKYNCENCSFLTLCKLELTGGDVQGLIKMSYQPNSYGYDKSDEESA